MLSVSSTFLNFSLGAVGYARGHSAIEKFEPRKCRANRHFAECPLHSAKCPFTLGFCRLNFSIASVPQGHSAKMSIYSGFLYANFFDYGVCQQSATSSRW